MYKKVFRDNMTCFRMDSPQKNSGGALRLQGVVPVSGWLNPAEKQPVQNFVTDSDMSEMVQSCGKQPVQYPYSTPYFFP